MASDEKFEWVANEYDRLVELMGTGFADTETVVDELTRAILILGKD